MKVIEVFGLSRSGHHAIINWIIKNLCGVESEMEWKLDLLNGKGVIYINEANLDIELTYKYIEEHLNNIKYLILSYENTSENFTILNSNYLYTSPLCMDLPIFSNVNEVIKITVLRDFYNNLASRIKANQEKKVKFRDGTIFQWNVEETFIELWKSYARNSINKKNNYIKFEDWVSESEIRRIFLKENIGINEMYDQKVKGTHSSFGNNDYMNRFKDIQIPSNTKRLIEQDTELHYLIGKLGYEYIKL
jgi:hypothetical protein